MIVDKSSSSVGKDIVEKVILDVFAPKRLRVDAFDGLSLASDILCWTGRGGGK